MRKHRRLPWAMQVHGDFSSRPMYGWPGIFAAFNGALSVHADKPFSDVLKHLTPSCRPPWPWRRSATGQTSTAPAGTWGQAPACGRSRPLYRCPAWRQPSRHLLGGPHPCCALGLRHWIGLQPCWAPWWEPPSGS